MIKIFNGYEIDGSDTSFYLLTDQKELISKLVDYFVNLSIFDRDITFQYQLENEIWAPHRSYGENTVKFMFEDYKNHRQIIIAAIQAEQGFDFIIPCKIPLLLPKDIKQELRHYTETRPGGTKENNGMERPEGNLARGLSEEGDVSLAISFRKEKFDIGVDGMILNRSSLEQLLEVPTYNINFGCGPGFYYEYAAWIMNSIANRFPEVGISGGLDCGGGFTGGCTYASTIYAFERFDLPFKKAEYALKRLSKYFDCAEAHSKWENKKGIKYYGDHYFALANSTALLLPKYLDNQNMFDFLSEIGKKEFVIKKNIYQDFCTRLYSDDNITDEELIAATAISLLLKAEPSKKKMKDHEKYWDEWQRKCYLVTVRKDGHIGSEIWVRKEQIEKMQAILSEIEND